jgi:hypothetical protein
VKLAIGVLLGFLAFARHGEAQSDRNPDLRNTETRSTIPGLLPGNYVVVGAAPAQESVLREQIHLMQPPVLPLRVFFLPRWKYLYAVKMFGLHVPTGMSSVMFTHLPSRTVFIDNDRSTGDDWLGHWMAHELGHLATNNAREQDAEKAARKFRKRLKRLTE